MHQSNPLANEALNPIGCADMIAEGTMTYKGHRIEISSTCSFALSSYQAIYYIFPATESDAEAVVSGIVAGNFLTASEAQAAAYRAACRWIDQRDTEP